MDDELASVIAAISSLSDSSSVTFKQLYTAYANESLIQVLRYGKRSNKIEYSSAILLRGMSDNVLIKVVDAVAQALGYNETETPLASLPSITSKTNPSATIEEKVSASTSLRSVRYYLFCCRF